MKKKNLILKKSAAFKTLLVSLLFFVWASASLLAQTIHVEAEGWNTKSGPQYAIPSTDAGGGQQVVGITNGSWMDYTVNVVSAGFYTVGFRVATMQNNMKFQVKSMPSGTVLGTINITNTLGWNNWQTQFVNLTTQLSAGVQAIRIQSSANESCNFNWMDWITGCITPDVNQLPDQTVCNNSATAAKNFTGSVAGTRFNWTNNNPSIGLAASGSGDIPSFTAINTTNAPITATITVTPTYSGGFAYISNGASVSVINIASNTVVATIPVGDGPYGVSVSPDGSRVYVTNWAGYVSVINTSTNTVVATIPVGSQPEGVSVSPDGSRVYVANMGSNNVSVINTATNTVIATFSAGTGPSGVSVSPDGSRVYVANHASGNLSVINTATNTVVATIPTGTPRGVTVSPDGSRVYVANEFSDNVSVINTVTNTVVATVHVGGWPIGVSVSPNGNRLYVANTYGGISVVNTATNLVVATVDVGNAGSSPGTFGVSVSPDGSRVYAGVQFSNTVVVISTATNTIAATINLGASPSAIGNFISSGPVCTGASKTFTITVKPTPDVNQPINQTVCNNTATTAVNFTGSVAGTRFTWTNNNPSIGLAASGSGNIPSFTATNTTNAPVTATITVTPAEGAYFAYIPRYAAWDVSVINSVTNTVVASIPVSPGPWGVSVSPDGSRVYISIASNKTLTVINTATNTVVTNIQMDIYQSPSGVSVSPDGSRVYVATKSNLTVINTATNSPAFINIGGEVHYDVSVSPDGSRVYVTNRASNDISVINTATLSTVAIIPVGTSPHGVSVSPDGSRVYVCNNGSGTVSVINTVTNSVITDIPVGAGPWGVTVSPDGSRAYVANNGSGTVSVINTVTNSVVATIPVVNGAAGISVTPDGSRVYLGNGDVINTATNTVMATIPVGGGAAGFSNFITGNVCTGASKTFTITVNPTCNKFIPGRIEAEDFDVKNGPQYAIPSTDAGGGQQVVGIANGSWMDYNVNVLTTGLYKVDFRIATTQNNAQFQVKLGATVLGTITIPNTGGWSTWQTVTLNNIPLTAGVQTIRIQSINNASCNFNWTDWSLQGACNQVQAESFVARNGVQYAVPTNDPAGGIQHMTGFINGSWLDYNVPSLATGTYTVNFRVATPQNSVQLQIYSGGILKGTRTITNTGGWSNWQTQSLSGIALTAGQPIRIQVVANGNEGCNFNWFELCSAVVPTSAEVITQAVPVQNIITAKNLGVAVYPNPAEAYFNLKVESKSIDQVAIRVMDLSGRLLQQLQVIPGQAIKFGDKLKSGTYFVEVRQGSEKVITKVIKQ